MSEFLNPQEITALSRAMLRSRWHEALDHARREMHMEFVRWAQSHGATCVRKS